MHMFDYALYGLMFSIFCCIGWKILHLYGPSCCRVIAPDLALLSKDTETEARILYTNKMTSGFAFLAFCTQASPFVELSATLVHVIDALANLGQASKNIDALAIPLASALDATLWGIGCALIAGFAHHLLGAKTEKELNAFELRNAK